MNHAVKPAYKSSPSMERGVCCKYDCIHAAEKINKKNVFPLTKKHVMVLGSEDLKTV